MQTRIKTREWYNESSSFSNNLMKRQRWGGLNSKAFDKVNHLELFEELKKLDIYRKYLRLLQSLYWNQFACIRVEGECSEYINIRRGVRHGCVMSPDLFIMYSEIILRELEDENGIQVGGHSITNIRYADDTVLFSESEKDLQRLLNVVVKES